MPWMETLPMEQRSRFIADDGIWSIYFGAVLIAKVDEREMIIRD